MEENKQLLDTEEDELMEDDIVDDEDVVDDDDGYNFNDEEDDLDEDEPLDEDDVDEAEDEQPSDDEEAQDDKSDEGVGEEETAAPTKNDGSQMREKMQELLSNLGYTGTFEEAMAAYEDDKAKQAAGVPAEPVDYQEMARNDLRDINAAFGLSYSDFSDFDDLQRFASLRTSGATALEAFRATQKRFLEPSATATQTNPAVSVPKPSKDHLKGLPHAGKGESGNGGPPKEEIRALREVYPEISAKELVKVLNRVKGRR